MTLGIDQWMDRVSGEGWLWYVKYLAGNDTLLTMAHQAGPYFPKSVVFDVLPTLNNPAEKNPRLIVPTFIDSHGTEARPNMIWYNNRLTGGTRNECHFTSWGGIASPILNPNNTGSLSVWAFHRDAGKNATVCRVWICDTFGTGVQEEDVVLNRVGPVEPGKGIVYHAGLAFGAAYNVVLKDSPCRLNAQEFPAGWQHAFPSAADIVAQAINRVPTARPLPPDARLLRRRDCEFELFRSIEELVVLPRIEEGFATVDLFVDFANSVTNRRKSRSGASLELHAKTIFEEEDLHFSHDEESEQGKRPDFLFPSSEAYRDAAFPVARLQMLAVKTTCKDRWRQVIDEATRLPRKYLLTLQEGISVPQFAQIASAGITLVVPHKLHTSFHSSVRADLLTVEGFIAMTRAKCS